MAGHTAASTKPGVSVLTSEVDALLSAQIIVAWAGEGHVGDERRLGWWRSDLVSEFGGLDLFQRLLRRARVSNFLAGNVGSCCRPTWTRRSTVDLSLWRMTGLCWCRTPSTAKPECCSGWTGR